MFLLDACRQPEAKAVTDTREPKDVHRSTQNAPERHRLAHWPPPFRSGQSQPKIIRHQAGDKAKLIMARGWRLTRATFSEFSDD
jgi:hypothetical protein